MPHESMAVAMTDNLIDWQAVADELAGALRTTMLRNPTLNARDWDRASAALERYEGATCGVAVEFRNPSDP
ncbi:MAG TPA: hypothetical protein VG795_03810 [Acidimicrobiia bacterium]|nr:hypothetical protein [Acidimicrobiia bacterium]